MAKVQNLASNADLTILRIFFTCFHKNRSQILQHEHAIYLLLNHF